MLPISPCLFDSPPSSVSSTLSLRDALPIYDPRPPSGPDRRSGAPPARPRAAPRCRGRRCAARSEEHTSELQSRFDLVCRLLLEKKKTRRKKSTSDVPSELVCLTLSQQTVAR